MENQITRAKDLISKEEKASRLRKLAIDYVKFSLSKTKEENVYKKIESSLEVEGENAKGVRLSWDIVISAMIDKMAGYDKLEIEFARIDRNFVDVLLNIAEEDGVDHAIDAMSEESDMDEFTLAYAREKLAQIRLAAKKKKVTQNV